jgi:hypothetical protein
VGRRVACLIALVQGSDGTEFITCNSLQGKHKATKFTCKQRTALLTVLYQSIAAAEGNCPITRKVLG